MKGMRIMSKYILVYKSNEANDWSKLPEPEIKKVMDAWGEWVGSIGTARKDGGAFKFGAVTALPKTAQRMLTIC
jgi:hypothetical protein